MTSSTISVHGTLYDKVTGLPVVDNGDVAAPEQAILSSPKTVITKEDTSRPTIIKKRRKMVQPITPPEAVMTRTRSPMVARFAPRPARPYHRPAHLISDIGPAPHPIMKRVEPRLAAMTRPPVHKPAAVIKQEAIHEAFEKAPLQQDVAPVKTPSRIPRIIISTFLALALMCSAGYLTYINLPHLSIYIASSRSGIKAKYPSYKPDGYSLANVRYDSDSVSLDFKANGGPQWYTVRQSQTIWDSTALNENVVKPTWGDDAVPYSERGLTIYAHEGNAVWVNGGILYEILGDAQLSAGQIRSIASSL